MGIEAERDYDPEAAKKRVEKQAIITRHSAEAGAAARKKREELAMQALAAEKAQELAEAQKQELDEGDDTPPDKDKT